MTAHRIRIGMLAAAASIVFVSADADASKEKFERNKPHVNIGTMGNQNSTEQEEKADPNENAVGHADDKAKFKRSQGDEAGTLKGDAKSRAKEKANKTKSANPLRSGDEDVASKTDKDAAARAKRKH